MGGDKAHTGWETKAPNSAWGQMWLKGFLKETRAVWDWPRSPAIRADLISTTRWPANPVSSSIGAAKTDFFLLKKSIWGSYKSFTLVIFYIKSPFTWTMAIDSAAVFTRWEAEGEQRELWNYGLVSHSVSPGWSQNRVPGQKRCMCDWVTYGLGWHFDQKDNVVYTQSPRVHWRSHCTIQVSGTASNINHGDRNEWVMRSSLIFHLKHVPRIGSHLPYGIGHLASPTQAWAFLLMIKSTLGCFCIFDSDKDVWKDGRFTSQHTIVVEKVGASL